MSVTAATVAVGDELPALEVAVDRARLVHYAGASGDRNPIHWDPDFATGVGLPDVIAHGMLTMGRAIAPVALWAGDPGAVVEYGVRFTKPVPVPDPGTATVTLSGKVGALDAEAGTVRVDITAKGDLGAVLGKARAVVRLPA